MAEQVKKTAAKKTAAKKTTKKTTAKKTAAKKTAAKASPTVEVKAEAPKVEVKVDGANVIEQARDRVEAARETLEARVAEVREVIEGALEEIRGITIENFRAVDADFVAELREEAEVALKEAGELAVSGAIEVNEEVLTIAESNVAEGFKTARAVLAAESVQDALEIQRDAAKAAFEAYGDQLKKVAELSGEKQQAAFAPIQANLQAAWAKFRDAA